MPLANDPIMQKRPIQSFGHLEHQNPSIILEDIGEFILDAKFVTHTQNGGAGQPQVLYRILGKLFNMDVLSL